MQDVLNSLLQAYEQLKALVISDIQSDADLSDSLFDQLRALRALIAAFRQAAGL